MQADTGCRLGGSGFRRADRRGRGVRRRHAVGASGAAPPLLVLHGYPTSSIDFAAVLATPRGGAARRPARLPGLRPVVEAGPRVLPVRARRRGGSGRRVARHRRGRPVDPRPGRLGRWRAARRGIDGTLGFGVRRRVLTNGSIYMHLVQLSEGQKLLESLPDEAIPEDAAPDVDALEPRSSPRWRRPAGKPRGPIRCTSARRGARRARGRQPAARTADPLHRGAAPARVALDGRDREAPVTVERRLG